MFPLFFSTPACAWSSVSFFFFKYDFQTIRFLNAADSVGHQWFHDSFERAGKGRKRVCLTPHVVPL